MNTACLLAGFILLFNPVIHIVDVIPDAIGFFLIVAGLTKPSAYIEKFAAARDGFFKLAWIEIVKVLSFAFIPYSSGSAKLLLAFVFGVIELLLFIPALTAMTEGFSFAGVWYNGTAIYQKKTIFGKPTSDLLTRTYRFVLFFYIVRVCASIIPELTELDLYEHVGNVTAVSRPATSFKPMLYIIISALVVLLGVIYIIVVTRFFRAVRLDRPFMEALDEKYRRDVLPNKPYFIAKDMKNVLFLFVGAALTSFAFPVDRVNLMIGVIPALFLLIAALILRKYVKEAVLLVPLCVIRAGTAVWNFIAEIRYFDTYSLDAATWAGEARTAYFTMAGTVCLENALALVIVLLFGVYLLKAVVKHLPLFGLQYESIQISKQAKDRETYAQIRTRVIWTMIFAGLHYAAACLYPFLILHTEIGVLVTSVVSILYIVYAIYTASFIRTRLYEQELNLIA